MKKGTRRCNSVRFLLLLYVFREHNRDGRANALFTLDADCATQIADAVFYNRQPQSCAADFLRVTLIYAVEALEDAFLLSLRNSDSVVFDRQNTSVGFAANCDSHAVKDA